MKNRVVLQITGPEHTSKTNLMIVIHRLLKERGIEFPLPLDTQVEDKLNKPMEELLVKIKDMEIIVMETKS